MAFMLILAVGIWTASKSIFYHAHVLSNGEIVYHAHPYKKASDSAPFKHHKHTDAQISAIDSLSLLFLCLLATFSVILIALQLFYLIRNTLLQKVFICESGGRAPPTYLFNI